MSTMSMLYARVVSTLSWTYKLRCSPCLDLSCRPLVVYILLPFFPLPARSSFSQNVVKQGEDTAAAATTQAEGALAESESNVEKVESKVDGAMAKLPGAAAGAGGGEDASRALPGLDGVAAEADPYAQDPEDKKMFGTCKVPDSCVIS